MPFSHGHALLIGVGSYQDTPRLNVPITVADARAVAQVLRDPHFCGYPEAQVTLLHDAQATSAGILAALDQLAERAGLQDTVVLFYSGHGDFGDDGEYHLTSYETRVADGKVVAGTGLSQKVLLEKLRRLRARRTLLVFNACHSGAVVPALGATDAPPTGQNPPDELTSALLATGTGRIIISASRAAQLSYIGAGKLTLFTQALVSGLLGQGVEGRNGYISAFDLYTYIYTAVSEKVKRDFGAAQEPELTVLKSVGPFAVALYRGATALGAVDEQAAPPAGAATRAVSAEESRRALERIVSVGQGVAVGGNVSGGTVVGRDQINAQGSQGFINQASGPVSQNFGTQQNIDSGGGTVISTGGGDYAGGNLDKRQGEVFVDGSVISGNVIGASPDMLADVLGDLAPQQPSLEQTLAQARQAAEQARGRGDDDLADDLDSVIAPLDAARKADQAGRSERRAAKLDEARAALGRLVPGRPELRALAEMLGRVA
ncbi:MAG: caspase domain-containing protein [Roseiflexaceae bacterium]